MKADWVQLNASFVGSLAGFTLNMVIGIYVMSLRPKNRDSKLFTVFVLLMGFYYAIASIHNLIIDPDLLEYTGWVHTLALSTVTVFNLWFTYQIGGNPFKRESDVSVGLYGLLALICFILYTSGQILDDGTFVPPLLGYVWIIRVLHRKAAHEERIAGGSNRKSKMLVAFQWWALSCLLFWLIANLVISGPTIGLPVFIEWNYYIIHPLLFISTTYSAIVFLNYTPQTTSFQAKLAGLILASLLIFLGLTPILLTRLVEDLPGQAVFVQQMLVGFVILIPVVTLLVVLVLPLFLRHALLTPLNRVLEGVKQVNEGNLATQLPIEVQDEVGILTHQFNQMTVSLLRYNREMEALVSERTLELQQSLATLQSTQNQLVQKEKMAGLGELTAGVAHEIQNPLNFVTNFAEVSVELADELAQRVDQGDAVLAKKLSAKLSQNMQHIAQSGQRASSIVRNMLEHSRTSTDERQLTDLNTLASDYLKLAYQGFRAKNQPFTCALVTTLDPTLPKINVAPQDLSRVFLNLYNNAFYALRQQSSNQPTVTVRTQWEGNRILVRIRDNGVGIREEIISRIFQPFFTTKPTGQGTGLGLSLSYDLITKRYGGDMQVVSELGRYTEFSIYLPINQAGKSK